MPKKYDFYMPKIHFTQEEIQYLVKQLKKPKYPPQIIIREKRKNYVLSPEKLEYEKPDKIRTIILRKLSRGSNIKHTWDGRPYRRRI